MLSKFHSDVDAKPQAYLRCPVIYRPSSLDGTRRQSTRPCFEQQAFVLTDSSTSQWHLSHLPHQPTLDLSCSVESVVLVLLLDCLPFTQQTSPEFQCLILAFLQGPVLLVQPDYLCHDFRRCYCCRYQMRDDLPLRRSTGQAERGHDQG